MIGTLNTGSMMKYRRPAHRRIREGREDLRSVDGEANATVMVVPGATMAIGLGPLGTCSGFGGSDET